MLSNNISSSFLFVFSNGSEWCNGFSMKCSKPVACWFRERRMKIMITRYIFMDSILSFASAFGFASFDFGWDRVIFRSSIDEKAVILPIIFSTAKSRYILNRFVQFQPIYRHIRCLVVCFVSSVACSFLSLYFVSLFIFSMFFFSLFSSPHFRMEPFLRVTS